jgi:hypothetical protein
MATAQEITSEIARLQDRLRIARNGLKDLNPNLQSNQAILARYRDEVANIPGQILALEAELKSVLSPASAGAIVGNANQARDNNANSTRPIVAAEVLTPTGRIEPAGSGSGTNAVITPTTETDGTAGTDPTVRTISQTQATPQTNPFTNNVLGITGLNATAPVGGPGAGAPPDDQRGLGGGPTGTNALRNRLDQLYAGPTNAILSQDNILDQYPSYTYSLSWYLMDPDAYNQIQTSIKKDLNGYYLLAQSGGAPLTTGVYNPGETGPLAGTAGRSPYFNLDYYIDNFSVNTAYSAKLDSGGPAEYTTLEFTISEPNGISLPQNLYAAMNDLYKSKGFIPPADQANYASGLFCMIVRFYGYDDKGQLIQPIARNVGATDSRAAVEKYIFFAMTDLKYSVGSKLVEYRITGSHPSTNTGQSSNRGSIPADYQFSGATVRDILVGQIQQQTASQAAGDQTRNGFPIKFDPGSGGNSWDAPPSTVDKQAAAIAAGTDPNTINDQGMAFGGGGL